MAEILEIFEKEGVNIESRKKAEDLINKKLDEHAEIKQIYKKKVDSLIDYAIKESDWKTIKKIGGEARLLKERYKDNKNKAIDMINTLENILGYLEGAMETE